MISSSVWKSACLVDVPTCALSGKPAGMVMGVGRWVLGVGIATDRVAYDPYVAFSCVEADQEELVHAGGRVFGKVVAERSAVKAGMRDDAVGDGLSIPYVSARFLERSFYRMVGIPAERDGFNAFVGECEHGGARPPAS